MTLKGVKHTALPISLVGLWAQRADSRTGNSAAMVATTATETVMQEAAAGV